MAMTIVGLGFLTRPALARYLPPLHAGPRVIGWTPAASRARRGAAGARRFARRQHPELGAAAANDPVGALTALLPCGSSSRSRWSSHLTGRGRDHGVNSSRAGALALGVPVSRAAPPPSTPW